MALLLLLPSAVCGVLCYWQCERMAWKDSLIKLRHEMLGAEPRDVYAPQELKDYEKVNASGVLLHDRSCFVGPRPRSIPGMGIQLGFLVVTPLYDAKKNRAVLVNRGWVPSSWQDDVAALEGSVPGGQQAKVTIMGVVQPSENPSASVPKNVPDQLEFHWFDVPNLARSCGLPPDTPLVQEISDADETLQAMKRTSPLDDKRAAPVTGYQVPQFPIAKNSVDLLKFTTMPVDHGMYAATWGALFIALGFMARSAVYFPVKHRKIIHAGPGGNNRALWAARGGRD
ncbi:hypothetical protein FOA52_013835 [Chlamydomonas sp. UWO 241]|nr:hypothetical protein FOA52_013835 [Chlamydomonas sp. UWO 241]